MSSTSTTADERLLEDRDGLRSRRESPEGCLCAAQRRRVCVCARRLYGQHPQRPQRGEVSVIAIASPSSIDGDCPNEQRISLFPRPTLCHRQRLPHLAHQRSEIMSRASLHNHSVMFNEPVRVSFIKRSSGQMDNRCLFEASFFHTHTHARTQIEVPAAATAATQWS